MKSRQTGYLDIHEVRVGVLDESLQLVAPPLVPGQGQQQLFSKLGKKITEIIQDMLVEIRLK